MFFQQRFCKILAPVSQWAETGFSLHGTALLSVRSEHCGIVLLGSFFAAHTLYWLWSKV